MKISNLAKFSCQCNSGSTQFKGKVHLMIYCTEDRATQHCQGNPAVRSRESEGIPLLFKLLLGEESGSAGSTPSARPGQWFLPKGLYTHNPPFMPLG